MDARERAERARAARKALEQGTDRNTILDRNHPQNAGFWKRWRDLHAIEASVPDDSYETMIGSLGVENAAALGRRLVEPEKHLEHGFAVQRRTQGSSGRMDREG